MSLGALAFLGAFALVILGIARWLGKINTDQAGFTELTSFDDVDAAKRAREVLERAKIPTYLDDHHGKRRGPKSFGITRLMVAEGRAAEAISALKQEASYVEPKTPPA